MNPYLAYALGMAHATIVAVVFRIWHDRRIC